MPLSFLGFWAHRGLCRWLSAAMRYTPSPEATHSRGPILFRRSGHRCRIRSARGDRRHRGVAHTEAPARTYIHYGWPASPYAAKTRAALRTSGLPWTEAQPHGLTFAWLQAHIGRKVIPVLRCPDGRFVQDSSRIIDALQSASGVGLTPATGFARVVALWLEVFADEWMIYAAMYFRWLYAGGDYDFMVRDFGRSSLPGLPPPLQDKAGLAVAEAMNQYLPVMGVSETTGPAIEAASLRVLDAMQAHLDTTPFLLGASPCIADFAMYGPIAAHIGRDPWSAPVIDSRPALRRWVDCLGRGERSSAAPLVTDPDTVPASLATLLREAFALASPAWREAHRRTAEARASTTSGVPRRLGTFEATLGSKGVPVTHRHDLTAVTAWKMQRPLLAIQQLAPGEQERIRAALQALGAGPLAELEALAGYGLDEIRWHDDQTSFGPLGVAIDALAPLMRVLPARRPIQPKASGPIDGPPAAT